MSEPTKISYTNMHISKIEPLLYICRFFLIRSGAFVIIRLFCDLLYYILPFHIHSPSQDTLKMTLCTLLDINSFTNIYVYIYARVLVYEL
jgi:hypothetical protein